MHTRMHAQIQTGNNEESEKNLSNTCSMQRQCGAVTTKLGMVADKSKRI